MGLVFPVGVPLLFLGLMARKAAAIRAREARLDAEESAGEANPEEARAFKDPELAPIQFLYSKYKQDLQFQSKFEVLNCLRRIVLGSFVCFLGETSVERAYWGSALALISAISVSLLVPFKNPHLNVSARRRRRRRRRY